MAVMWMGKKLGEFAEFDSMEEAKRFQREHDRTGIGPEAWKLGQKEGKRKGVFGFFSREKSEKREQAELLQQLVASQVSTYEGAVDADQLPAGHGPFGLCDTNPIPTASIDGSNKYLARLRTSDGKPVTASRFGSTSSDVTTGSIDIYFLAVDGRNVGTVYICPYHKRTSSKAPAGFRLV